MTHSGFHGLLRPEEHEPMRAIDLYLGEYGGHSRRARGHRDRLVFWFVGNSLLTFSWTRGKALMDRKESQISSANSDV